VTDETAEFSRCDAVTDEMQIRQRTTNPMNSLPALSSCVRNCRAQPGHASGAVGIGLDFGHHGIIQQATSVVFR
jgi:hypothetical protein